MINEDNIEYSINYIRSKRKEISIIATTDIKDILNLRKEQFNMSYDDLRKFSEYSLEDIIEESEQLYNKIAEEFLNLLSRDVREKLQDIYIGVMPTNNTNASTFKMPNGKPIITIDMQLMTAIQQYNEARMLFGKLINYNKEKAEDLLISSYKEIVKCFKYHNYLPKMSFLPNILTKEEIGLVIVTTYIQEMFIIAHEYAHIYLGHLDSVKNINLSYNNEQVNLDKYITNQKLELDADIQALKWIIEITKNKDIKNSQMFKIIEGQLHIMVEVLVLLHLVEVNTNMYKDINSNLCNHLTVEEYQSRFYNVITEWIGVVNKNNINNKISHPSAMVRMMNLLLEVYNNLDKSNFNQIKSYLDNCINYESFRFDKII